MQSTLRQDIFARKYMYEKLTKYPNFTWYLAERYFSRIWGSKIPFNTPCSGMFRNLNKKVQQSWQNQRVSYAFTSSPFSFHARHTLPTSKFQHSYYCILLIFYRHQWTACVRNVSVTVNTVQWVHWFDASCSAIPLNNSITLISPVQSL